MTAATSLAKPTTAAGVPSALPSPVKLVIWDLDETFWRGTLAEGPVVIVRANVERVKALNRRGIVSAICSKNDFDAVRRELQACDAWSDFVFPRIAFQPKGEAIAGLIEQANLRPQNVLFIDDNPLNLAEARHFAPGLMTADPAEILVHLLDLEELRGKDDPGLTRLQHYRNLEQKALAQAASTEGPEAFLRDSGIEVSIDPDVEPDLDRIVELINRSNQLNFTKVRLETPEAQADFRRSLSAFGAHAGAVRVRDRYGDYGLVGFFLLFNRAGGNRLVHFVFSCRIMHMGVEQFVYERLNCPAIDIAEPIASPLRPFAGLDWIHMAKGAAIEVEAAGGRKLTLLGGCDLLQVANYCSPHRAEYVNHMADGVITHYDDAGFVLSPRGAVERSQILPAIPCWTKEDAFRFDADLGESEVVIVSLWDALLGQYMRTDDGVLVRLDAGAHGLADYVDAHREAAFVARCEFLEATLADKARLLRSCLERIAALSGGASCRVVLGRNLAGVTSGRYLRDLYNRTCRRYCEDTGAFHYLDVDAVLQPEDVVDGAHLTRMGYHRIATRIRDIAENPSPPSGPIKAKPGGIRRSMGPNDLARRAWFRRRGAPLGRDAGRLLGWIHQAKPGEIAGRIRRSLALQRNPTSNRSVHLRHLT